MFVTARGIGETIPRVTSVRRVGAVTDQKAHWETVYRTKRTDELSWFQREPAISLDFIRRAAPETSARIIDVGGGASRLVDELCRAGYSDITVLDLSPTALAKARARLGDAAARVRWLEADVLNARLPEAGFDLWHDRAVFHFLTSPAIATLTSRKSVERSDPEAMCWSRLSLRTGRRSAAACRSLATLLTRCATHSAATFSSSRARGSTMSRHQAHDNRSSTVFADSSRWIPTHCRAIRKSPMRY